ncbi:MAG: glycosyltransferase [Acidimicrobiia bacterium]
MIDRVAYISMHTSPLALPGHGNAGGMNVYLDRLSKTMANRGVEVTVFTRRTTTDAAGTTEVVPGYRVVQIDAGPPDRLGVAELVPHVRGFAAGVMDWIDERQESFDIVHSHYWLSGRTGVRLKRRLDVPLANSFHTLGKVKDALRGAGEAASSDERLLTEEEVIANSNCVIASTPYEFEDLLEHYGASPERLCVSPPGVDHDIFSPGSQAEARSALDFGDERIVLYVGRIQRHKGTSRAVEALADMPERDAEGRPIVLHIVGGASGADGEAELEACQRLVATHALSDRVRLFDPVRHPVLVDHYRSADVVIVPSRSESFGLVAAEAQACGIPVVASNTGGLPFLVNASESVLLVDDGDPRAFASAMRAILDHPSFAERLGRGAVEFSERFSWDATATRMLELYSGISA